MKTFKRIILTTVIGCGLAATASFSAIAQTQPGEDVVYTVVEQLPVYLDGGEKAMYDFISQNVKYPREALEKGIEGRVFVSFIIDKEGKNQNAKVEKGIGGGCDQEALRVVKLLTNWAPAQQNGKIVSYRYIVPIRFALSTPAPEPGTQKK